MSFTWDVNEEAKVRRCACTQTDVALQITMNSFSNVCFGFMDILLALMVIIDDEVAGVVV